MEAASAAADPLVAARDRYLANLAALYRRDGELAARIDALPFSELPALEACRDGRYTARVAADDGQPIYLHSRYQPGDEASRFVGELPAADAPTFILLGVGLGHHVAALERRFEAPVLIVAEPDLRLLKAALCLHDLAAAIDGGRMIFLPAAEKRLVHEKLSRCNADLMLGMHYVAPPYTRRVGAAFCEQIQKLIGEFVSYQRMQIVTLLKTSRTTFRNVSLNLAEYLASPGVGPLAGRAKGLPAVVVAAGPSLARHVGQLGALRERAVLIGVQTVFKLLHAMKCPPHFVTSLDFHEVSVEFFRGVEDVGDCTLVAEPKAAWRVLDVYPGRKRVLHHHWYERMLGRACPRRGGLPAGTTVAHLAFYLAQHLGCNPIIFIGQDLAFTEGLFYVPGSPIERIWGPELGRFQTVEMKQWERIVRNRGILRRAADLHGRPVYTDELLLTYFEQFTKDFAAAPQRIIQASEGGLAAPGMEVMSLGEAVKRFCTRPLPAGLFDDEPDAGERAAQARAAAEALEACIAEIDEVAQIAKDMRGLLGRLVGLVEKPEEFNRVVARVDELRLAMQRHDELYRLVTDVSAQAELRRYGADRRIGTPDRETAETARRRLERDVEFVDAFLDSATFLARALPDAAARVRALAVGGA